MGQQHRQLCSGTSFPTLAHLEQEAVTPHLLSQRHGLPDGAVISLPCPGLLSVAPVT